MRASSSGRNIAKSGAAVAGPGLYGARIGENGSPESKLAAFERLARLEGIIPALETAHAIALVLRDGARWKDAGPIVVCLSGRGDKDVAQVAEMAG